MALQQKGAHNINLVTPSHFSKNIINALDLVKDKLSIPVCYNTSGYDDAEIIKALDLYVDIYLTDIKFFDSDLSKKYSNCPDYFEKTKTALDLMIKSKGKPIFEDGLLKKGVIIRHLVMPSCYKDSLKIIDYLGKNYSKEDFLLSLMSQYTPLGDIEDFPELKRTVTTYEYEKVVKKAEEYLFEGYFQNKSSIGENYVPDFDLTGVDF